MKRNPLAAVVSALRSLFKAKPKTRTVTLLPPPSSPGESENRARLRRHSKHSAISLPHRRHWRPARRAALSLRWSRAVMGEGRHPVASMWRAYCADRNIPVARKMGGRGWKSWKKQARSAVAR